MFFVFQPQFPGENSLIDANEWNCLSNLVKIYDDLGICSKLKSIFHRQMSMPPKIRSKSSTIAEIVRLFFSTIDEILLGFSFFFEIPREIRQIFLSRNIEVFGIFHGIFLVEKVKALDFAPFVDGFRSVYGENLSKVLTKFVKNFEPNENFVKLSFFLLSFSTNCSIVEFRLDRSLSSVFPSVDFVFIEFRLVEIIWKYFIVKNGFRQSVQRFSSIVKMFVDFISINEQYDVFSHRKMLSNLVQTVSLGK